MHGHRQAPELSYRLPAGARPGWTRAADVDSGGSGNRSRFNSKAFTATMTLEPDIEIAAISGLSMMP